MAPRKPIKTYTRQSTIIPLRMPNSVDAIDALFAANLSKRKQQKQNMKKKKPITIKELPAPDENHHLLHDSSSLSFINADDTFDKLRKASPATDVCYKPPVITVNNGNQLTKYPKCFNETAEKLEGIFKVKDEATGNLQAHELSFNNIIFDNKQIATRSVGSINKNEVKLPKYLDETVNESLCIEVEKKVKSVVNDSLTLDSIACSTSKINNTSPLEVSSNNLFSTTFKDAMTKNRPVIASTPASTNPCVLLSYLSHDTLSPILPLKEEDNALLESYRDVHEWSYLVPSFDDIKSNRARRRQTCNKEVRLISKRKYTRTKSHEVNESEEINIENDWKLKGKAVVKLDRCLDIIGVNSSIKLDDIRCDWEGWSLAKYQKTISDSLLGIKFACETFEKSVLNSSAKFFCSRTSSRHKSLASVPNSTKNKSELDLSKNNAQTIRTNECAEDLCSDESLDNSGSLFSPEKSETYSTANTSKIISTPLYITRLPENNIEMKSSSFNSNLFFNTSDHDSPQSSTPIVPSRRRPVQIAFDDIVNAKNILQNICNTKDIFDKIESVQTDHSYSCPNISDVDEDLDFESNYSNDESVVIISDDDDDDLDARSTYTNKSRRSTYTDRSRRSICTNKSAILFHNYSKTSNDSIPLIDLTKENENDDVNSVRSISSTSSSKLEKVENSPPISLHSLCDSDLNDYEAEDEFSSVPILPYKKKQHELQAGKLWRRSFLNAKKSLLDAAFPNCSSNECGLCTCCTKCKLKESDQRKTFYNRRISVRVLPEKQKVTDGDSLKSVLENYAAGYAENVDESRKPEPLDGLDVLKEGRKSLTQLQPPLSVQQIKACDIVLARCGQTEPISFTECYTPLVLKDCRKIGEGVYGEVFEYINLAMIRTVMKIIPIEGDQPVNGEHQKKFEEILSEIIICVELSNLRSGILNKTSGFSEVYRIKCVKGRYPTRLLDLWELWDKEKRSENDSPAMFKNDQLYMILELAHGGRDMEEYVFKNSEQALSLFKQMAFSLAVAETTLKFEHRDLHWGNVLINAVEPSKSHTFNLDGNEYIVPSYGIEGSIIDFTLSRITLDSVCIYNDLSLDPELFVATGDYQFDIYRLMQKRNGNRWSEFNPYTNVLWLHYTVDKMISDLHYRNYRSKLHFAGIQKLIELKNVILEYNSVKDLVRGEFLT